VTPRDRERRLAALEAAAALRAKAEAANAVADLLTVLSRQQLRAVVHVARDLRDGKMTETEAEERLAAVPGIAEVLATAKITSPWVRRP